MVNTIVGKHIEIVFHVDKGLPFGVSLICFVYNIMKLCYIQNKRIDVRARICYAEGTCTNRTQPKCSVELANIDLALYKTKQ